MSGLNKSHNHYFKGSHLLCPPGTKNEDQEEVKKNVADYSLSSLERKKNSKSVISKLYILFTPLVKP